MNMVSPALQAVGSGITRLWPHEPAPQLRCPAAERLCRHRVAAAPDMAMAGGTRPEHLNAALESVADWIKTRT